MKPKLTDINENKVYQTKLQQQSKFQLHTKCFSLILMALTISIWRESDVQPRAIMLVASGNGILNEKPIISQQGSATAITKRAVYPSSYNRGGSSIYLNPMGKVTCMLFSRMMKKYIGFLTLSDLKVPTNTTKPKGKNLTRPDRLFLALPIHSVVSSDPIIWSV